MNELEKIAKKFNNALKTKWGGNRNHYLALAYLMKEFDIEQNKGLTQIAFNQTEFGINAFHFDSTRRNLYLLLVSWSSSMDQIRQPLRQFGTAGMDSIFATEKESNGTNRFSNQITACLLENSALIDQIYFRILTSGPLSELQQSEYLKNLMEQLEQKKYLVDRFFNNRPVRFTFDQRTITGSDDIGPTGTTSRVYAYYLPMEYPLLQKGPQEEQMII